MILLNVLLSSILEVRCPYTGNPQHGEMLGDFPALYGTVVTYRCNEGFALVGDSYQVCNATGIWTGNKPACEREYSTM